CEGRIFEGPNDKGRWEVQVDYQCELKTLSLLAANLQPKPSCGWELVVAPLGAGVQELHISEPFSKFGRVRSVNMTKDENVVCKGVCLVEMTRKEDAEAVLKNLARFEIKGREIKIDWSAMAKTEMGMLEKRREEADDDGPTRNFKEASPFEMGQAVLVSNLKGAPQFNGVTGTVVGFSGTERCEVELKEAPGVKKVLALKFENLSSSTPAEDASEASPRRRSFAESDAKEASAAVGEGRRRRASAWDAENSGGFVVNRGASDGQSKAPEAVSAEPLPTEQELSALPVKELKRLLAVHRVETTGCLEKSEFLEKARALIAKSGNS
ncbi:unnamed protein product, partial [Polarella glacialis]